MNPEYMQDNMPEDVEETINNLNFDNSNLVNQNKELQGALASSGMFDPNDQNSIRERLETDKILERIEHFLKGDVIKFDERGSYYTSPTKNVLANVKEDPKTKIKFYMQELVNEKKGSEVKEKLIIRIVNSDKSEIDISAQDSDQILDKIKDLKLKDVGFEYVEVLDDSKRPLNEYGVSSLMRTLSMYVCKETILSNYKEERIMEILGDLGNEMTDFFYENYEKMGMDTKFKETMFKLMVINILHIIESGYRRAIGGAEQRNLNIKGIVTQNDSLGGGGMHPANKPRWNLFNKSTW